MCPNASSAYVSAPSEPGGSPVWKSEVGNLPLPSAAKLGNPRASKDRIQAVMRWDRHVPWGANAGWCLEDGGVPSIWSRPTSGPAWVLETGFHWGVLKYSGLSQPAPCPDSHSPFYPEPPGALRGRDGRGLFRGRKGHFRMTKITIHSKAIFTLKQNTTNGRH